MSVSLRPVYRAGKAPARPPIWLALAALLAALTLTGVDIASQLRTGLCQAPTPIARVAAPAPTQTAAAPAPAPHPEMTRLRSVPTQSRPAVPPAS